MVINRPADTDIISDLLRRVAAAEAAAKRALDTDMARSIERAARQHWGGDKVHIAKTPDRANSTNLAERNSRIHRAYLGNVRLKEIARQEGVTTRRVLQIIKR